MRKPSLFNIPNIKKLSRNKLSQLAQAEAWHEELLPSGANSNDKIEIHINRKPLIVMCLAVVVLFAMLFIQLVSLQIANGERYAGLADGNRLREKITYAQRGRILDRNGVVLADNTASFQLIVVPYLLPEDTAEREAEYKRLAPMISLNVNQLRKLAEDKGLDHTQSVLASENISYEQALLLEQKLPELSGFSLDAIPIRRYKDDAALSHVLGYVGRANEQELAEHPKLNLIDFIGKDGIERQYDHILRGQNGVVRTEVDAMGRPLRVLSEQATEAGQDIVLSIDYELQKRLANAIAKQMRNAGVDRAAGVAVHPRTGEVLASISLPGYDNNLFARGITAKEYKNLIQDSRLPLHNRVIAGGYPSGSIIKPLVLMGGLQERVVTEDTIIVDTGRLVITSQYDPSVSFTFLGWHPPGLGAMDARRAIALSSNIYFYTVGGGYQDFQGLGIDRLAKYYKHFGLGQETGIDLPGETAGRVPTPEWKREYYGEDWFLGDTYSLSIGQGDLLVSPLQMAMAHSAVANGGELLKPRVFNGLSGEGLLEKIVVRKPPVDPRYIKVTQEGMRAVVTGGGTTSPSIFANVPVPVAGKSGTAETDPNTNRRSHAWFSAYAPYEDPQILTVVLLEEGEGGSQFAAPAIAESFEWYFSRR